HLLANGFDFRRPAGIAFLRRARYLVQAQDIRTATALGGQAGAGGLDEEPAHDNRRERTENGPAAPAPPILIHPPAKSFASHSRRLNGVVGPFASQVPLGEGPQLSI